MEPNEQNETIEIKKNHKKFKLIFLLLYVALLLSIVIAGGLSKYKKAYAQPEGIPIAKVVSNIICDGVPQIEDLHNEEVEWFFTVNNFNGNKLSTTDINEVALSYTIEVDLGELTDLQYSIYSINGEQRTLVNINNQSFTLSNQTVEEDKYCMVIKTTDDVDQKSLEGNIHISIVASQEIE